MAKSSGVSAHVYFDKIPLIQGTLDLAVSQIIPGGTMNNHQWLGSNVVYDKVLTLFFLRRVSYFFNSFNNRMWCSICNTSCVMPKRVVDC